MPDTNLLCSDCRCQYTFTEGEQEFFKAKGFTPPTRCPECRSKRKAEKASGGGFSSGGGGSFGGGGGRGGSSRGGGGGRSRGW